MSDTKERPPLWAPWRIEYIIGTKEAGCIFCNRLKNDDDRQNLILVRGEHAFVIMNRYPYNNGHIMVAPIRHEKDITRLSRDEIAGLFTLIQKFALVFEKVMKPNGFNIGLNLGRCAGAGVEDHLHIHVVPRWDGDTNFMPVIGEVKVISEHILSTYDKLLETYETLT